MNGRLRAAALPLIALVMVGLVLGIQLAYGGASYTPLKSADPCAARPVHSTSQGIEGLTETVVLIGLDNAACSLGVSREALTLALAQPDTVTDAQIEALRTGMVAAVAQLQKAGALPPASQLMDEALAQSDLSGFVKALIGAIPDSAVDAALKTDDVLTRVIEDLDLRTLLANFDDQNGLNKQVQAAVTSAVVGSLVDRLKGLL